MKNKLLALFFTVLVVFASSVPAFASTPHNGRLCDLRLDTGDLLRAPVSALANEYIVVRYKEQNISTLFVPRYTYIVYAFDSAAGVYENASGLNWRMYGNGQHKLEEALTSEDWEYDDVTDGTLFLKRDAYTIVYSSFDYYDTEHNLVYSESGGAVSPVPSGVEIKPSRSYSMLPAASSVYSGEIPNNWLMFRRPYDDGGYQYWLYFFSGDFSFSFVPLVERSHTTPDLRLSASNIYAYRLNSDEITNYNRITDAQIDSLGGWYWTAYDSYAGSDDLLSYVVDGSQLDTEEEYSAFMNDCFIASSETVTIPATSGYYWTDFEDDSGDTFPEYEYSIPNSYWLANGSDSGSEPTPGESLAIEDILDFFGNDLIDFVVNLFKFLFNSVETLFESANYFFEACSDTANEFFAFFRSGGGFFEEVSSFFGFMSELWLCIPAPIRELIYFLFLAVVFFGIIRIFH